jgi:CRP-like cAMP-binding protein
MSTELKAPKNKLLAALPAEEQQRLLSLMTLSPLRARQVLQRHGDPLETVYFPVAGQCAIVMTMAVGETAEVATVGNEGMVGVSAFLCGEKASGETIVQAPGTFALAMPAEAFTREMEERGPFYDQVCRYSQVLVAYLMQSAACNGLHAADKRCARWLLQSHDRLGGDWFELTQEYLAFMLGVRRATVSMIAQELQRAGLIAFRKRGVMILDRKGLEEATCECYHAIRSLFDRLTPAVAARTVPY